MIVIVEGIDRVGKTTLCKKLEKLGFLALKDSWLLGESIESEDKSMYSIGKLDTTVAMLQKLSENGTPIVMDRLHLTELVYGTLNRGSCKRGLIKEIDVMLSKMNTMLVYVQPVDINMSNQEAGTNLSEHDVMFESVMLNETAIRNKYVTDIYNLDKAVKDIVNITFKYDFYFASPFFNERQVEREEGLKEILRNQGFRIFSPKEACFLKPDAQSLDREAVFTANIQAIRSSMAVFAITDEKDMGTIWEAGFAYGINKPIVYFAETLGNNQFNLMLAQSGRKVCIDRSQVTHDAIMNAILNRQEEFRGLIE